MLANNDASPPSKPPSTQELSVLAKTRTDTAPARSTIVTIIDITRVLINGLG